MDKRVWLFLKRYIFSKRKEWLKSDSIITMFGLVISVAVLCATLSIFTGYQKLLKKTILGVNSHIYIFSKLNNQLTKDEINTISKFLKNKPQIKNFGTLTNVQVMASYKNHIKGAMVRGINPKNPNIAKHIVEGKYDLQGNNVILGYRLAEILNAKIGDEISLITPDNSMITVFGIKNKKTRYKISGLYRSGMYEYDKNFIFADRYSADIFPDKIHFTMVEINLKEDAISKASYLSYKWNRELDYNFQINSWIDYNGNLFSLLTLEKWVIFIILSFLILISSFNIISSISTSIIKQRKAIGIMKTFGTNNKLIKKIFVAKVMFTSFMASIAGIILGNILSFIISKQKMFSIKGDVYFIDKIKADYSVVNWFIIIGVTMIIVYVSSVIPLKKISKLKIISVIRS